jgi:hypothetical protein
VSEPRRELLLAIALAPPEEVSTSERLKALGMLDGTDPSALGIGRRATSEDLPLSEAELDRQLDATFVVDVIRALSSRTVVNGIDPTLFPATGGFSAGLSKKLSNAAARFVAATDREARSSTHLVGRRAHGSQTYGIGRGGCQPLNGGTCASSRSASRVRRSACGVTRRPPAVLRPARSETLRTMRHT